MLAPFYFRGLPPLRSGRSSAPLQLHLCTRHLAPPHCCRYSRPCCPSIPCPSGLQPDPLVDLVLTAVLVACIVRPPPTTAPHFLLTSTLQPIGCWPVFALGPCKVAVTACQPAGSSKKRPSSTARTDAAAGGGYCCCDPDLSLPARPLTCACCQLGSYPECKQNRRECKQRVLMAKSNLWQSQNLGKQGGQAEA